MVNLGAAVVKVVKSKLFWKGASLAISLAGMAVGAKSHEIELDHLKDTIKKEVLEDLSKG
jgi:hypothetical protein